MKWLLVIICLIGIAAGSFYFYKNQQGKSQPMYENQQSADDAVRRQLEDLRKPKN